MVKDCRFACAAATVGAVLALSWTPAAAIAFEVGGPAALAQQVGSTSSLPEIVRFQRQSGEVEAGGTYALVSSKALGANDPQRILHLSKGTTKLDRCRADRAGDTLTPIDCTVASHTGTHAHEWTIAQAEGGFTIESGTDGTSYITLTAAGAEAKATPQTLTIKPGTKGGYTISAQVGGTTRYLAYTSSGWTSSADAYEVLLYKRAVVTPTPLPNHNGVTGTTSNQPFASGTGGSGNFRIPSLITGSNGNLYAAIDARWNHQGDAGGLDTIFSVSPDNGKTWNFSFPNYFNDSIDSFQSEATAFIDPVMVEKNGVIYMMVDLWPGGVALNTAKHQDPVNGSGYAAIDGTQRLVLFDTPVPSEQRDKGAEKGTGYTHYVGDFASDGYAPVIDAKTKGVAYYVDHHMYLFNQNKKPLYCQQLGSEEYVQQNVFYYRADLHVMATSHLWLTSSSDGGKTWSNPLLLNEQVRTNLAGGNASFYGVGPGRGLVTSTGRIILPCYTFTHGKGDGNTSVIYSDDGVTWHRSTELKAQTSEATVVEADGRLYLFARHGVYAVSNDNGATWENERKIRDTGIQINQNCQISALTYSRPIDGKTAIVLSCPTGDSRANGRLFVGLVQENGDIEWKYEHKVTTNGDAFAYSCVTELPDGSLGLLYEGSKGTVYTSYAIEDVAPGAELDNKRTLSVPLYGTYEITVNGNFTGYEGVDKGIVDIAVKNNGNGTSTVQFTGLGEGTVQFTEAASGVEYTIKVAAQNLAPIELGVGEKKSVPITADTFTRPFDESIAKGEISSKLASDALGETPGSLGSDQTFAGDVIPLSDALFTFAAQGDTWTVSSKTAEGKQAFLKIEKAGLPGRAEAGTIQLKFGDDGRVKLFDTSTGKHLHFWRDGRNTFDQCGGSDCDGDWLELYRPASGGKAAQDGAIPGYERVSAASEVKDCGSYLVVAEVDGVRYALNPSLSESDRYAHVLKVDPERRQMLLTVQGVAPGTTDALVGGTVYRVTVSGYLAPEFTWSEDYSKATATFKHSAGGEAKTLPCEVTCERVEPTATKDGKAVYTATVTFEGKTYTDTKTVVLSATGSGSGSNSQVKPGQGSGSNTGSKLPTTGDPMGVMGLLGAAGVSLSALGVRLRNRKR